MTDTYILNALLRGQRAMLIVSDRIQANFLYLQSAIYPELQYKQRDIYVLWKSLTDNYPFRASLTTYEALINVLIGMCQAVDSFNATYSTINPNYQDIGGSTTITIDQSYVTPVRLFFTANATPTISDYQTDYAGIFGNNPTFAVYLYNGTTGSYSLFSGASENLQYDITLTLLQSATFSLGLPQTGYILIST
jgi:hypothetical protein